MKKYTLGAFIGAVLVIGVQKLNKKFDFTGKIQSKLQELQQACELGNKEETQDPIVEDNIK